MLHKTKGIVLKTTKYSETSLIVQVYTENFGMQSYLLSGVRKSNSKISNGMLQPLHLLDMVVYHKPAGGLQRISEIRNQPIFTSIPFNIIKSSLAIFLCDVIYHSIKEQQTDEDVFQFLMNAILFLEEQEGNLSNFHLIFLLMFSRYLGFYPSKEFTTADHYFDLKNGIFLRNMPEHPLFLDQEASNCLKKLLSVNFEEAKELKINAALRKEILKGLIYYYEYHIEKFGTLKSHHILEEVLS